MGAGDAPTSPPRAERALVAFVRQEFEAPVAAIIGFAEILLEDARRSELATLLADLERIRGAGLALQALVGGLLDAGLPAAEAGEAGFAALRHDLRTPLNAVKGYAEMVMEEAHDRGHDAFGHDVRKLLQAADQMLGQIDALVALAARHGATEAGAGIGAHRVVHRVIGSIQPVSPREGEGQAVASRILVVDDTAANRDLLTRRLSREGHLVAEVEDGRSALQRVAAERFDLVLLDL
jgi:signal transduction histidine kinase